MRPRQGQTESLIAKFYSTEKHFQRILEHLGVCEQDATKASPYIKLSLRGNNYPVRALVRRGTNGQFALHLFSNQSKIKKPYVVMAHEVYAHQHGYKLPDPYLRRRSPDTLAAYCSKLVVDAGIDQIPRDGLPLLPPRLLEQMRSRDELYAVLGLINGFCLRRDIARAHLPQAYERVGGWIAFAESMRSHWCRNPDLNVTPQRWVELWKMLYRRGGILLMKQERGHTLYQIKPKASRQAAYDFARCVQYHDTLTKGDFPSQLGTTIAKLSREATE
jgi:hypothetical protein